MIRLKRTVKDCINELPAIGSSEIAPPKKEGQRLVIELSNGVVVLQGIKLGEVLIWGIRDILPLRLIELN